MSKENIEELLKNIGSESVPPEVAKIAEKVSIDFSKTLTQRGQPKHYVLGDYIMKSRLTKLAVAAAVIIVVVLVGMPFVDYKGPTIALADVLAKVEQVQAFMYKMKIRTTVSVQPGMPSGPVEMTGTVLISTEYGTKMDMDMNMVVNGVSQKMRQIMYMLPQEKKAYVVMPEQKQYMQMEYTDDLLAKMKKESNDPREFLRQILNSKYTNIGKSIVDGVEVEGFETTDPACIGGMAEDVRVTLWVDRKTELPVRQIYYIKMGEQMQMEGEIYDFQWYVQVNADEFEPVIPQDYTNPLPNYKMPTTSEEGAIEGFRFCKQMMGRYPKKIDLMNLMTSMPEILGVKDRNNPTEVALKLKEKFKLTEDFKKELDKLPEEEKTKKIVEMTMEIMKPIQSLGMFYMTLVQEKKEPVYYGESVMPVNADKILLRWKVSDSEYRIIYGDLHVETVTLEKLAELEAALPK